MKSRVKSILSLLLTFVMLLSAVPVGFAEKASDGYNFNRNWFFNYGDVRGAEKREFNDSQWRKVNLPHDFSIEQNFTEKGTEAESGSLPGGCGWYRKHFTLPQNVNGKRVFLNFDGAYNNTYLYVNGKYAGENHYGYNAFSFDITDKLICDGETINVIAVKTVHNIPSGRWYSGSGLFRDVSIKITEPVHIAQYGTHVKMPELEKTGGRDGRLVTEVKIDNALARDFDVKVKNTLYSPENKAVSVSDTLFLTAMAGGETKGEIINEYKNPSLWSPENPALYVLLTEVFSEDGKTLLDSCETVIGYRYFDFSRETGFSLNGVNTKIKGVCMHHDQGALGAVQEYEAIKRQALILKSMGVNAIRTSHNCASSLLLGICAETGLMVLEEFFDGWDSPKAGGDKKPNIYDFSEYFNKVIPSSNPILGREKNMRWFEFVIKQTVKKDRNNPAIIMWSAGNEVLHGTDRKNYQKIAADISSAVKSLDSERPLTEGNNAGGCGKNPELDGIDSHMDVIGGNYFPDSWVQGRDNIKKPFVATESASAVSSRGVYKNSRQQVVSRVEFASDSDKTINSYDNSCVGWGDYAAESWYYAAVNDWFSGEFVWTGFDYIGEPTPWNVTDGPAKNALPNSSYFGIIDTAGLPKDSYYLYRSLWNENEGTLHLVPSVWNRESLSLDNGFVSVAVYSDCDRIELFLNGEKIGSAVSHINTTAAGYKYPTWKALSENEALCRAEKFNTAPGSDFYPQFSVKYEEGSLSVKGYKNGEEVKNVPGVKEAVNGKASSAEAVIYGGEKSFPADSLFYVEYKAVDSRGNFIGDNSGILDIEISGGGIAAGVDNGHGGTKEKYQASVISEDGKSARIRMQGGQAVLIVRTDEKCGSIKIKSRFGESSSVLEVQNTGSRIYDEFEAAFPQGNTDIIPGSEEEPGIMSGIRAFFLRIKEFFIRILEFFGIRI